MPYSRKTGRVRRILCLHCNTVLGMAKDDITVLRLAVEYLEAYK